MDIVAFWAMTFSFMSGYDAFYGKVGSPLWTIYYYGKYVWILLFIILSLQYRHTRIAIRKRNDSFHLFLVLPVIIFIYSVFVWLIRTPSFNFITRGISNTVFECISFAGGVYLAFALNERGIRIGVYSILFTYSLSIIIGLINGGSTFLKTALFNRTYAYQGKYTELHEVAFTLGLYIIIFALKKDELKKLFRHPRIIMVLCIAYFIIAWKRIGIFAVIVSIIIGKVLENSKKLDKSLIRNIGIVGVVLCLVFVSFSTSDELVSILQSHNIEMSGRNIIYNYFRLFRHRYG